MYQPEGVFMKQYLRDCIFYLKALIHVPYYSQSFYVPTSQTLSSLFIKTVIKSMGLLFVSQNAVEVPKRDYSVLPLLAAPPQVGERIAFKVKNFEMLNVTGLKLLHLGCSKFCMI